MDEKNQSLLHSPLKMTLFVLFLFVLALAVLLYLLHFRHTVWTNDANIEAFGTDLSTDVTEKIMALYVDEGDFVKKGDLIAILENNIPIAQKAAQEAQIKSIEEEIAVLKWRCKKIRNDFIRADIGFKDKVVSEQDFDHAEKDLGIILAEIKLAYANLELARKELQVIDASLVHYTITAPHDGVIAKRWVWIGDVTTPGQSLYTMYDLNNVWVLANLEEGKIENVKLGDPVEISIDAYPGYTFEGNIFTIKGAAASQFSLVPQNNATGNYTKVAQRIPLKISIRRPSHYPENQPLYLFPGMSAEVRIKTSI